MCLEHQGRHPEALVLARRSGAHVGRSSLGLTDELDRLLGPEWRTPLRSGADEHQEDLLGAVDLALEWLEA